MTNQPWRVVFMGCPDFSVAPLKKLASDSAFEIEAVYCMPDRPKGRGKRLLPTPVKQCAKELGIEVNTPSTLKPSVALSEIEKLKSYKPDFLVVAAYGLILSQTVLDIASIASVNLHASVLPAYRGPSPIHYALLNGDTETGNTIMLMSRGIDEGDMLAVKTLPIAPEDNLETLRGKLSEMGADLLCDTLKKYALNEIKPIKQDHSKATYTKKITPEAARINFNNTSKEIVNQIKALYNEPSAWFEDNNEHIKVFKATSYACELNGAAPGTVLKQCPKQGIIIACGQNTALKIEEIQRPGKKRLTCAEYLCGCRLHSKVIASKA